MHWQFFPAGTQAQDVIYPSFVTASYFCPHLIISYYTRLLLDHRSRKLKKYRLPDFTDDRFGFQAEKVPFGFQNQIALVD